MEQTEAEVKVTRLIATAIVIVLLSIVSCTAYDSKLGNERAARERDLIKSMIKEGQSPIAARCAVRGTDTPACTIYAAKDEGT